MQLKRAIRRFAVASGVFPVAARCRPPRAAILRYHSVRPDATAHSDPVFRGIVHTTAEFEKHMELLASRFSPVSIDAIERFLEGGEAISRRAVAVTFDDGYRDNYECAAPILRRYGVPAAFYVAVSPVEDSGALWFSRVRYALHVTSRKTWMHPVTGKQWSLASADERHEALKSTAGSCATMVGEEQERAVSAIEESLAPDPFPYDGRLMMTWQQIRDLEAEGHIVGSHTMSHPNLAQVREDRAAFELAESKRVLESRLGHTVRHFSYPHPILDPHWNASTTRQLRELGYTTAVTCDHGTVDGSGNPLCLPRLFAPCEVERLQWLLETNLAGLAVR